MHPLRSGYELTYDCETAPHVRDGLLTLAICKPKIRKLAAPGEYYERSEFRNRWDCVYERRGERLV